MVPQELPRNPMPWFATDSHKNRHWDARIAKRERERWAMKAWGVRGPQGSREKGQAGQRRKTVVQHGQRGKQISFRRFILNGPSLARTSFVVFFPK